MNKPQRRYDIDWLRTIGVLLVIPFHTLLMFNLNPYSIVYIKDKVNVRPFIITDDIIDRFHMPLLFILAGMSIYFALQSRSTGQFVNERVNKLLVPALFGSITLNPVMTYMYMISKGTNGTFIDHLIKFLTSNPGDLIGQNGAFTPAHLWFIIFLFVFSLAGLPIFIKTKKGTLDKMWVGCADILGKPLMLLLFIVPVTALSAIQIMDDKNPLVYFSMFFIGFLLMTDERYQKAIDRDKWIYLILGTVLIYLKLTIPNTYEEWSAQWIIYGFMDRAGKIVPVFALIGIGKRFLNKNSKALGYLSQASFPVYVLHMLINTVLGFYILKFDMSPGVKVSLIITGTYLVSFGLYEIIRRSKILSFLFGIKALNRGKFYQPDNKIQG